MACAGRWMLGLMVAGLLAGCGGGPRYVAQPAPDNLPAEWRDLVAEANGENWLVLGFGKAEEEEGAGPLAGRSRAESKARADLARRVKSRIGHLRAELGPGLTEGEDASLDKADLEAILKRGGDIAVNQSRIIRRDRSPEGVWQALARTGLAKGLREAARNRQLPGPMVDRVMRQAREALGSREKGANDADTGTGEAAG
ncbi:hypothetical protein [Thiohalorhabdus methylotrophus]|uniref:LPP20 lipoprotein n=1 Tax=Thiohalorhabdus methylotrophus TaxID=3242694 RepID=A0ABV4TXE7_9GAMM